MLIRRERERESERERERRKERVGENERGGRCTKFSVTHLPSPLTQNSAYIVSPLSFPSTKWEPKAWDDEERRGGRGL